MTEPEVSRVESPYHAHDVVVGAGVLQELGERLSQLSRSRRAALISDAGVASTLLPRLEASLAQAGIEACSRTVPSGETHKTLAMAGELLDWLALHRFERQHPIVALGGGVTGDCVGFVAATYLRGVPLVHCPTTLLAMADSSIGGKVAVNLARGKNLVGAIHQPLLVVSDLDALATLPDRDLRCGFAECVIHCVLGDASGFDWMEQAAPRLLAREQGALQQLVMSNVRIKAGIVAVDEREAGRRMILNLGHTFGHAIEAALGYQHYRHGEAVALGLLAAGSLANARGMLASSQLDRIRSLLTRLGLPTVSEVLPSNAVLLELMRSDKKVAGGVIRLVLPEGIGAAVVASDVSEGDTARAWDTLRA